jgi:hypothetical protein
MSPRGQYERPDRSSSKLGPRPKRRSFGADGGKLQFQSREGYQRRVFNDVDGRIAEFQGYGWEPVKVAAEASELSAGDASKLGSVVRKPVGGGVEGVLMEIPKEWFEEDQAAKEARRLSKEQSLLSEATELSKDEGITIKRPGSGVMIE